MEFGLLPARGSADASFILKVVTASFWPVAMFEQ